MEQEIDVDKLPDDLAPIWQKALEAIQRQNLQYAIKLIQHILKREPGFLEGRKTLRNCEVVLTSNK